MNNEAFELLTPASVWIKEDGKQAKVLFVTNTTLPERHQQKHPVQVVYLNEEANIYSRTLDSFFKIYQFFNIDPELEERLVNLVTFSEDDYDNEDEDQENLQKEESTEDDESDGPLLLPLGSVEETAAQITAAALKITEEDTTKLTKPLADYLAEEISDETQYPYEDEVDDPDEDVPAVTFIMSQGSEAAVPLKTLQDNLVSYVQEPNKQLNLTHHKLTFLLGGGLNIPALKDSFIPDDIRSIVDAFLIKNDYHEELVAWTDYIGTFPEIVYGRAFASVIVATENSPLISEEEAQAHIHGTAVEAVEDTEFEEVDYASLVETMEQAQEGFSDLPDMPAELFIPQLSTQEVVAQQIEELNRQQAGPLNLIGNELNSGFSVVMVDGVPHVIQNETSQAQ